MQTLPWLKPQLLILSINNDHYTYVPAPGRGIEFWCQGRVERARWLDSRIGIDPVRLTGGVSYHWLNRGVFRIRPGTAGTPYPRKHEESGDGSLHVVQQWDVVATIELEVATDPELLDGFRLDEIDFVDKETVKGTLRGVARSECWVEEGNE